MHDLTFLLLDFPIEITFPYNFLVLNIFNVFDVNIHLQVIKE